MRKMRDSRTSWKAVYINLFLVIQAGHIKAVIPVIQDLEDKICEDDERLQDFVDGELCFIFLPYSGVEFTVDELSISVIATKRGLF